MKKKITVIVSCEWCYGIKKELEERASALATLLGVFAKARAEADARSKGRGGGAGPGELRKVMGEVRRAISVQVIRSQALCLLERLGQLEPGARAAGERRKVVQGLEQEEVRRRQAQAYKIAHRNRGLCRVGRAFVPSLTPFINNFFVFWI